MAKAQFFPVRFHANAFAYVIFDDTRNGVISHSPTKDKIVFNNVNKRSTCTYWAESQEVVDWLKGHSDFNKTFFISNG